MAGSLNKVILIGNLGADPEVKSFQNGGQIALLRIATSESWKDRTTGDKQERTEWHSVVINSDGLVGVVERYLRKGSKVYIEGQLRTRKWQDQSGNDRYTTEIAVSGFDGKLIMLDGASGGSGGGNDGWGGGGRGGGENRSGGQRGGSGGGRGNGGGQGGGNQGGWGNDDWGSGGGSSGGGSTGGGAKGGNTGGGQDAGWGGAGGGWDDDLDDDVPF